MTTSQLSRLYDLTADETVFVSVFRQLLGTGVSPSMAVYEARIEADRRCLDIDPLFVAILKG